MIPNGSFILSVSVSQVLFRLDWTNNNFWPLLHVPDTDDVKQKNKNHKTIPWTENKQVFCLTSSVSSTRNFEPIFIPPGAGVIQSTYFTIPYNSLTLSSVLHAMLLYKNPPRIPEYEPNSSLCFACSPAVLDFFFYFFIYLFFFLAVLDLTYLAYAFTPFRSNPSNPFVERAGCSGSQPADFVRTQLSAKQTLIRNRFCPDRSLISHSVFTGTQSILCHQCAFHNIHKQWPGRKRSSQVGSLPTTPPLPPSSLCLDNSRHIYSMKAEIQNGGLHPTVGGGGGGFGEALGVIQPD